MKKNHNNNKKRIKQWDKLILREWENQVKPLDGQGSFGAFLFQTSYHLFRPALPFLTKMTGQL